VSSAPRENVDPVVTALDLAPALGALVGAEDVTVASLSQLAPEAMAKLVDKPRPPLAAEGCQPVK
jgi:hypothetical protein